MVSETAFVVIVIGISFFFQDYCSLAITTKSMYSVIESAMCSFKRKTDFVLIAVAMT